MSEELGIPSARTDIDFMLELAILEVPKVLVCIRSQRVDTGPPIETLPVELLVYIFQYCAPHIRARINLTSTCRHWRLVALETPILWTYVHIHTPFGLGNTGFDRIITLLHLQLARTKGLFLDVFWRTHCSGPFDSRVIDFLRREAPFSQWRTLTLWTSGIPSPRDALFDAADAFPNLESLTVQGFPSSWSLKSIMKTVTPKLKILNLQPTDFALANSAMGVTAMESLHPTYTGQDMINPLYDPFLQHITDLALPKLDWVGGPILPPNVARLSADTRTSHPFPHLQQYNLKFCRFAPYEPVDLSSLVHLTASYIWMDNNVHIDLPSLRRLQFSGILLGKSALLTTPVLEELHIGAAKLRDKTITHMLAAVNHPGHTFSPTKLLVLEHNLPTYGIIRLLEKCPKIEQLELAFDEQVTARQAIDHMFDGCSMVTGSLTVSSTRKVCTRLTELKLNFRWPIADVELWKKRASRLVRDRMETNPTLSIYGMWKGQGSYMRLT